MPGQRRPAIALIRAALLAMFTAGAAHCDPAAAGCRGAPRVWVGGVTGFAALANPAASARLRNSCNVGLYLHTEGWKPLSDAAKTAILRVFEGTGPAIVELGYLPTPQGYFPDFYRPMFLAHGVRARTALVNGLCKGGTAQAKQWIDVARSYGLKQVADVFAPNSGQFKTSSFASPQFDCIRDSALYGGALAVDAPPHIFLAYGSPYQAFVGDEIRWANTNHVAVYDIISPNASQQQFFADTMRMLAALQAGHAMPGNFVFETYDIQRTDAANTVGNENDPATLLGVALETLPYLPH